ncbi:hypothetical protein EV2_022552 [Malus domestica]
MIIPLGQWLPNIVFSLSLIPYSNLFPFTILIVASTAPIFLRPVLRKYYSADDAAILVFTIRFLVWSLLVSVIVAFSGVFSRLLYCMLPKKRPGDEVVVEIEVGRDTGSSAPTDVDEGRTYRRGDLVTPLR